MLESLAFTAQLFNRPLKRRISQLDSEAAEITNLCRAQLATPAVRCFLVLSVEQ